MPKQKKGEPTEPVKKEGDLSTSNSNQVVAADPTADHLNNVRSMVFEMTELNLAIAAMMDLKTLMFFSRVSKFSNQIATSVYQGLYKQDNANVLLLKSANEYLNHKFSFFSAHGGKTGKQRVSLIKKIAKSIQENQSDPVANNILIFLVLKNFPNTDFVKKFLLPNIESNHLFGNIKSINEIQLNLFDKINASDKVVNQNMLALSAILYETFGKAHQVEYEKEFINLFKNLNPDNLKNENSELSKNIENLLKKVEPGMSYKI